MASRLDLQPLWQPEPPRADRRPALADPWGQRHRPDWAARGLIIWPRGGREQRLRLRLSRPSAWDDLAEVAVARLCLRWWAEAAELQVDGASVHRGDLFDTACRWRLPQRWWQGEPLELELRLTSPRHDDGALIHSHLELEPRDPADPRGLLAPVVNELESLRHDQGLPADAVAGSVQVLGHAHLDLAWLWPVADTWAAAERTFSSVLALMERWPELRFGHSTPALYAWLERHRPALFHRIREAMGRGRWEPLNGPWVECDCQLIDTPSLLRQFQLGQHYSRRAFPEWRHEVAWLPDSFGFAAGLPAVARATGVRWFCTHKLAWNATNPFPHRVFRWRSRCGAELLALMTAPIGTDGDPVAIESQRLSWRRVSGVDDLLWLPGVGDHGGGPTAEMLEQLALWQQQPAMAPLRHGTLRDHLAGLEALAPRLPVWRDELYLELHRGCATSRPDQKRHNRTLERLLREAELARALLSARRDPQGREATLQIQEATGANVTSEAGQTPAPAQNASDRSSDTLAEPITGCSGRQTLRRNADALPVDWRPLLFQQFHDILPGTSIPEVFEQAEPQWRAARRQARQQRDLALLEGLGHPGTRLPTAGASAEGASEAWWAVQLQPLPTAPRCVRLPAGAWRLLHGLQGGRPLHAQVVPEGGVWLQLPMAAGVSALALARAARHTRPPEPIGTPGPATVDGPTDAPLPIEHPVSLRATGDGGWQLDNGLLSARCGAEGVEQLWDADGRPLLASPLRWCRWRDRGEFWDAWDIAADHRDHPLPWNWEPGAEVHAAGPLCAELIWRGRCGDSPLRLTARLLAGTPWLELLLSVDWRQRHELLQLELPLARSQPRWAGDTAGGVIERPAVPHTQRERSRWEVTALSWIASPELAVLLDGPQGVSATAERLTVSLLRAPTWPDPGADNGWQRLRLGLMATPGGWREARVPQQARRLREPLWLHPSASATASSAGVGARGQTDASIQNTPAPATHNPAAMAEGTAGVEGLTPSVGAERWPGFPALGEDLRLVGLRAAGAMGHAEAPGDPGWSGRGTTPATMTQGDASAPAGTNPCSRDLILTLQNEGPCRRRLELPHPWRVVERLDGLDQPMAPSSGRDPLHIAPWQLCCWRLRHEP